MTVKFVVVANCQARPMSRAIEIITQDLGQHIGTVITHLSQDKDVDANIEILNKADLIFAQAVQKSNRVSHLVTENLKREFPGKVISWPNIYFTGHSPQVCYLSGANNRRIAGPLLEYHYKSIYDSWRNGEGAKECEERFQDGECSLILEESVEKSFSELRQREESLDVIVSDFIEKECRQARLFFTFNHPSAKPLINVAEKLIDAAGIRRRVKLSAELLGEPLDRIIPPISERDAQSLSLRFETSTASKGVSVTFDDGNPVYGPSRIYCIEELIKEFYRAYDAQLNIIDNVRYTPL